MWSLKGFGEFAIGMGLAYIFWEIVLEKLMQKRRARQLSNLDIPAMYKTIFLTDKGLRGHEYSLTERLMTITKPIVDYVNEAKVTLDVCFYVITAYNVVEAIIAAKQRGVLVRVIVDYNTGLVNNEYARKLLRSGIQVFAKKMNQNASIMHHKFCIRDNYTLLQASMNLTQNTSKGSFDNLFLTDDEEIVKCFIEHFEELVKEFSK